MAQVETLGVDVKLVCFLYQLGHDVLPLGKIEELIANAERTMQPDHTVQFSNQALVDFAIESAIRLAGKAEE